MLLWLARQNSPLGSLVRGLTSSTAVLSPYTRNSKLRHAVSPHYPVRMSTRDILGATLELASIFPQGSMNTPSRVMPQKPG